MFICSELCATCAGVGFACVEFALLVLCISQLHTRTGAAPAHSQLDIAGFISRREYPHSATGLHSGELPWKYLAAHGVARNHALCASETPSAQGERPAACIALGAVKGGGRVALVLRTSGSGWASMVTHPNSTRPVTPAIFFAPHFRAWRRCATTRLFRPCKAVIGVTSTYMLSEGHPGPVGQAWKRIETQPGR